MKLIIFFFLFEVAVCLNASGQNTQGYNEHSILFYNTENLFDLENDSLTNDDEFTRTGDRHWNRSKLLTKVDRISKVILASGKWNAPLLIGLCEIEGLDVLEELCQSEALKHFHYKIIQKDSPDARGIDVALLYRSDYFSPYDYSAIPVVDVGDKNFRTRDILQVSGVLAGKDTIHLFVNHWPSRFGGLMESKKHRLLAAKILKEAISNIQNRNSNARIICMGDFNDTPSDESLSVELLAEQPAEIIEPCSGKLVNLSFNWTKDEIQTIKNKYRWEIFDQFIVSDFTLTNGQTYSYINAGIVKNNFLLEPDLVYGGMCPKRTYIGYKYHGGFSDHLPVVLRINLFKD